MDKYSTYTYADIVICITRKFDNEFRTGFLFGIVKRSKATNNFNVAFRGWILGRHPLIMIQR